MKLRHKRALLTILPLTVLSVGSLVGSRAFHSYRRQRARAEWAEMAIEEIGTFARDETVVSRELKQLADSVDTDQWGNTRWYSERLLLTADGKWLAYKQTCSKAKPHIRDLFIGYSSDGRWYYSSCHFCVNMIAFAMCQDYQPATMEDLLRDWHFREFDGRSERCMAETAKFPDMDSIEKKRPRP